MSNHQHQPPARSTFRRVLIGAGIVGSVLAALVFFGVIDTRGERPPVIIKGNLTYLQLTVVTPGNPKLEPIKDWLYKIADAKLTRLDIREKDQPTIEDVESVVVKFNSGQDFELHSKPFHHVIAGRLEFLLRDVRPGDYSWTLNQVPTKLIIRKRGEPQPVVDREDANGLKFDLDAVRWKLF